MEAVNTSWPRLTAIVSAHAAERKVKVLTLVLLIMIAMLVIPLLKNNAYSCPLPVIGLKEKCELKKSVDNTPQKDSGQFLSHLPILCDGSGSCGRPGDGTVPWFEFRYQEEEI